MKTILCATGEKAYTYDEYLETNHWRVMRQRTFCAHGTRCSKCSSTKNLHIHHKHYKTVGNEDPEHDLIPLCKKCHTLEHFPEEKARIPKSKKRRRNRKKKPKYKTIPIKTKHSEASDAIDAIMLSNGSTPPSRPTKVVRA